MPNSAEIIERLAVQATCQKILLTLREDCEKLEDIEKYVLQLLKDSER